MALECEVIQLTPELARGLLDNNKRNRRLRPQYVRQLAGAMQRGEWAFNGEPIQVAEDGELLNGQHRLHAVADAGVTVPVLLVKGLPTGAQRTMDSGTRRTLSDVLALNGEKDTTNLAAALGLLHRYRKTKRLDHDSRTAPTPHEALELLSREPGIRDWMPLARKVHRATKMRMSATMVLAHLFEEVDPGKGVEFFHELSRAPDKSHRTVRGLQSILERNKNERHYRLSIVTCCAITIKSFNAWRDGRDIALLAYKAGGKKPEPFPKINQPAR